MLSLRRVKQLLLYGYLVFKLIKLIQAQPKVYKLEGQKRLHIQSADFDDAGKRAPLLAALLQRLAPVAASA